MILFIGTRTMSLLSCMQEATRRILQQNDEENAYEFPALTTA